MPSLRYVLRDPKAANCVQTSVDELLRTIAGCKRRKQEELTESPCKAVHTSKFRRLTAKSRRLREYL